MKKNFTLILVCCLISIAAALAIAASNLQVYLNGSMVKVRSVMRNGVPYLAAPDLAKALGKPYKLAGNKVVIGAPGGSYAAQGDTAEVRKWAFNGKIKARIVKVQPDSSECYDGFTHHNITSLSIEIANATSSNYYVRGRISTVEIYNQGNFVTNTNEGFPIDGGIPPGAHARYKFCVPDGDLAILRPDNPKDDGSPIKLKLK